MPFTVIQVTYYRAQFKRKYAFLFSNLEVKVGYLSSSVAFHVIKVLFILIKVTEYDHYKHFRFPSKRLQC